MNPRLKNKIISVFAMCGILFGVYRCAHPELNKIKRPVDLEDIRSTSQQNTEKYPHLPDIQVANLPEEKITGEVKIHSRRKKMYESDLCL